jgi:pyruvate,water dikinase
MEDEVFDANVHSIPAEALVVIKQAHEAIGDDGAKRTLFDKELSLARLNNAEQEDHNFHLDQTIIALLRLPCIEAAERLKKAGIIDQRDDVFFLKMDQLQDALAAPGEFNYKELVRARKLLHTFRQMLRPPPSVGGESAVTANADVRDVKLEDVSVIQGVPASRGSVTGTARVVSSSEVVPDLKPGEILVSYNAGPMWTPLFPIIGGLVLDGGNVLLHAALVAREYKIPAVFMTGNGSKVIKDGQTITVDGTAGTVHLR